MFCPQGQNWTFITDDDPIYTTTQLINWRNMDEFKDDHMKMGDMRRSLWDTCIGQVMEASGFNAIVVMGDTNGS